MSISTSEILAANDAFYRAFEKKDMEAMSNLWSQGTGSLCIHPGRKALHGWKEIRASWEQIFKNTAYIEIETEIISTEIREHIGYVVLTENVMQVIAGRKMQAISMATNIFEFFGGKWYLVHHHGSPLMR
ncbi:MAG: nuclear transport factor 2 family protein [Nostocaceae cyanobacterium]|nr:nuclear transport factor 2 family protein [Nostocaceae cyanobacterium]